MRSRIANLDEMTSPELEEAITGFLLLHEYARTRYRAKIPLIEPEEREALREKLPRIKRKLPESYRWSDNEHDAEGTL